MNNQKIDRNIFLKELKKLKNKLEKKDILYDIPFDYRSKEYFDFIKIMVSDTIDKDYLLDITKGYFLEEKNGFILIEFNSIPTLFIKTNEYNWLNVFYYYSGIIISDCINIIANQMGLKYDTNGLTYINSKKPIHITNKVFEIFNFFELDVKLFLNGFNTRKDIYNLIINSQYFNVNLFKPNQIDEKNILFLEKNWYYNMFLDVISVIDEDSPINYEYKEQEYYLQLINDFFPESNLLEKFFKINIPEKK